MLKNIPTKLRSVYLPFLLCAIGLLVGYTLLRWLLDVKLGIIPLKDDLLNFWIPIILSFLIVWFVFRRRIKILNVEGKNTNGRFLYQLAMTAAIAIPLVIAQHFIISSSFDLIPLSNAKEVEDHPLEKYFGLEDFELYEKYHSSYVTARTSGRHNEHLTFYYYHVLPFRNTANIWYGVEYQETISNRLSDFEKEAAYTVFERDSRQDLMSSNLNQVTYFERLAISDDLDGYREAIAVRFPNANLNDQVVLLPRHDAFEERSSASVSSILLALGIGLLVIFIMVIVPEIDQEAIRTMDSKKQSDDDLDFVLSYLNPLGPYRGTAMIILLNSGVFIIMVLMGVNFVSPTAKELLEFGANNRHEVLGGAFWRLLTSTFIHAGIMHLGMNLMALMIITPLLEEYLGWKRFVVFYLISGILASVTTITISASTISVGASGAIFGLFGIMLAFNIFKIYPDGIRNTTWTILGLYAGLSLLFGFIGFMGGVDNAAHIGGLVVGFLLGIIQSALIKEERGERLL